MSESIASLSATTDSTYGHGQSSMTSADVPQTNPIDPDLAQIDGLTDLRLIIEDGPADGIPIYKTVDARTGEVVHEWLREQVLRMREAKTYVAGQLIKTRA